MDSARFVPFPPLALDHVRTSAVLRADGGPQRTKWVYVGNFTEYTMNNMSIDNYLCGAAAVVRDGNETRFVNPVTALTLCG